MKIHNGKINNLSHIELWGTGKAKREFLFVEDLAEGLIFLMNNYDNSEIINVGTGEDISISDLAKLMCEIIGYKGEIKFNENGIDGVERKVLNISKITKLGWQPLTSLEQGIKKAYNLYLRKDIKCIKR
jgi:GDP-L-fucose synthase